MFKLLLIFFALFFIIFRVGGFFLRLLFGGVQRTNQANYNRSNQQHKPKDGNVNVDYIPDEKKGKKNFKGGDYIDYEEV